VDRKVVGEMMTATTQKKAMKEMEDYMGNFDTEKLAVEYCEEHGIDLYDLVRGQVITAFCIATKIEREACAKACEELPFRNSDTEYMQENCARAIRGRSKARPNGQKGGG